MFLQVKASDLKPLAKPQRSQKLANGKSASASPAPRQQAASASPSASSSSCAVGNGASAATPKTPGAKTPKASPAAAAPDSSELDSELKRVRVRAAVADSCSGNGCLFNILIYQAELRTKQEEDEHEKQAALVEMKNLADKLLLEGYARQAALADLRSREDRVAKQIALLSKSFQAFGSTSSSPWTSSSHGAAVDSSPTAAADHGVADVQRCIEGIKKIQAKSHDGSNQAVLVSQLGLAVHPKVRSISPKSIASATFGLRL